MLLIHFQLPSNQMKISLLFSFLLLATLLHEAQGMNRKLLKKTTGTPSTPLASSSKKLKVEENTTETKPKGKTSSTTITAENHGGKKENFSVKSSPVPEHRQAVPKHYPDVLDIAGMDYSPERRKSPIHN